MPPAYPDSAPLTVAMLAPTRERCGIGDYTRRLVTALRALPEIAAVNPISPPEGAGRVGTAAALKNYLAEERLYAGLGRQLNASDIAHIQHQYFFFGGVAPHKNHFPALLNAVQVPVVLTVHEIADGGPIGWKQALIARTNRSNFLHPAIRQIVVHTQADAQKMQAIGVAPERLVVLPIAVPPAAPLSDREQARAALGLTGKRVLLMFGFLSTKKGHFLALEALQGLPEDVVLLLAGDRHPDDLTDYVPRLQEAIRSQGLEKRVLITGYLPEEGIPAIMAAADLALAPFLETSGSASLAHLLAYGLPVLASDIPPHRELLAQTPGSILLFPTEDAVALSHQITELLGNTALRETLYRGAERFCAERSFDRIAREILLIYRKVMHE